MFAVPGWNLTAPLRTQTEPITVPSIAATGHGSAGKKRKRSAKDPIVTDENVVALWEKHVEDRHNAMSVEYGKQKKRKKRMEKEDSTNNPSRDESNRDVPVSATTTRCQGKANEQSAALNQGSIEKERNKKSKRKAGECGLISSSIETPLSVAISPNRAMTALTPLQKSMRAKLASARFRHLNETLYTKPSSHSLLLFSENPEMFDEYHAGFRQQVEVWPRNPVDGYIKVIRDRGCIKDQSRKRGKQNVKILEERLSPTPLPRTTGICTVADLGCGDARLALELQTSLHKLHLRILSFDFASKSPLVTKADIAKLPLADGSVDVAIFCLALMGTNWLDFIEEAWRILRWKGELWITEIQSRFSKPSKKVVDHSVGKHKKKGNRTSSVQVGNTDYEEALAVEVDGAEVNNQETDVGPFIDALRKRGFTLSSGDAIDASNKMFVRMEFVKATVPVKGKNLKAQRDEKHGTRPSRVKFVEDQGDIDEDKILKPCVYKLR